METPTDRMSKLLRTGVTALLAFCFITPLVAQELSGDDMLSLDGQVQEVKSDALAIASELSNLEERLLYPSGTQVSLFVALDNDDTLRLDSVKVEIDGALATHHIYSFNELDALRKGGVQRLYTSNVATGDHELKVTVLGLLKNGKDFSASETFVFSKDVEPKTLGITVADPDFGKSAIRIGDW